MTYRERRERKAERLFEWADKRETKASEADAKARQIADIIPFGQPILVGHHSEGRHRRDLERIRSNTAKSIEHGDKAKDMRSRATNIESQLERSIYDNDPDAVERLEERIATLEDQRDRIKRYNATCRKGEPDLSILTEAQRKDIASVAKHSSYALGNGGQFPAYALTNLSGNIKRNKDRLVRVKRQKERARQAEEAGGVVVQDTAHGWVTVTFAEKPEREVIDLLKSCGFMWRKGSWYGERSRLPEGLR